MTDANEAWPFSKSGEVMIVQEGCSVVLKSVTSVKDDFVASEKFPQSSVFPHISFISVHS